MPKMDWKNACEKLREEGLKFDFYSQIQGGRWFSDKPWIFTDAGKFRIAAQPIPDREDWREWCRNLKKLGVEFEYLNLIKGWSLDSSLVFSENKEQYRIPAQSIPAGIEKYLEEEMPGQKQEKPEIPNLEQQIQWHKDSLHSLETGEKMREWEYRLVVGDGEWKICNDPHFSEKYEYRRKPRTVTYWHCVLKIDDEPPEIITGYGKEEMNYQIKRCEEAYPTAKFSPIIETTVELED